MICFIFAKRLSMVALLSSALIFPSADSRAQSASGEQQTPASPSVRPGGKSNTKQQSAPNPEEELQQAVNAAGGDRAALVRNLEDYLKRYPGSPQRPRIYRALVEASLQLRDRTRAADYAERIVSLKPDDMSMTLIAIQLLEERGEEAGMRRALSYCSRVVDYVQQSSLEEKSPRVSPEEWQQQKLLDQSSVLRLRGRLHLKLKETVEAQKDFQQSYLLLPTSAAAEQLGEIAELGNSLTRAITEYARAFALADSTSTPSRREIRQKLGNVWRLAHGSEEGLGDYLLTTFDEMSSVAPKHVQAKNSSAREPLDFTVRKAPEGTPFPLAPYRHRVLVVNFWATWCGPCRALEPLFDRVAAHFAGQNDVAFLAANCDEDESLVAPFLEEEKPRTMVVFADGLDRALAVSSFPTVVVLDRAGKIAYRSEGFGDDHFEENLAAAVARALAFDSSN
ncbi:MAG TPA: redoxin family protein [Candidatus Acidoferrales bacterium]|nr:redoxin family protein [Candidatus Acidoferrales bacterium]